MLEDQLIDLAVEGWRFTRVVTRAVTKLDAGEGERYASRIRFFQKKIEAALDSAGLRIVNVEGQRYEPGIAASAVNLADFGPDSTLLVDQMIEPIVMGPEGLKRPGTVTVREVAR